MRYVTFSLPGDPRPRLGAERDGRVTAIDKTVGPKWPGPCPDSLQALIDAGPDAWRRMAELIAREGAGAATHALKDVRVHAPLPRPRKNVLCLGRNYKSHIEEAARGRGVEVKLPEVPVFFTKAPTSITG